MKIFTASLSLAISAVLFSTTLAAGSGNSPKGKPFIAINDQIVEVEGAISSLQDQIEILVGHVDTIEQRVTANEAAIASLQNQNAILNALTQQNLSDIASIEGEILLLQQTNADLQTMIATNSDDITTLQGEVAANDAMIATLQSSILLVSNDLISLETSLQSQIEHNETLIVAIQDELDIINSELALKQNIINGTCPDGSAMQQILLDGSVICEGTGGTSGQLQTTTSYQHSYYTSPGQTTSVLATCPTGYVATSAGFERARGWDVYRLFTIAEGHGYDERGLLQARNNNTYSTSITVITTCTRIAP